MDKPNRLPLLQSGFRLLINNLRPIDTVSIITYGGGVAMVLAPTGGQHKDLIKKVIDSLSAGGDTPGAGAIQLAYETAKKNFIKGGNNRVILATDGDFNVGQSSEKELEGGEIGSGHAIMAIAEIIPAKDSSTSANSPLAEVILRFKDPFSGNQKEQYFTAPYRGRKIEQTDSIYRFAAAVAMFGNILRKSKFTQGFQLEDVALFSKHTVSPNNIRLTECFFYTIKKTLIALRRLRFKIRTMT